jgi:very-short-patch-repair endonuclease
MVNSFTLPPGGSAARNEQPGRGIRVLIQGSSTNMTNDRISSARDNRKRHTVCEGLQWSSLRAHPLCGLKFRPEHPIGGFIADFACEAMKLVIEIDGGYHDPTTAHDVERVKTLRSLGWDVIWFTNKEVEQDAESMARGIRRRWPLPEASSLGFDPPKGRVNPMSSPRRISFFVILPSLVVKKKPRDHSIFAKHGDPSINGWCW